MFPRRGEPEAKAEIPLPDEALGLLETNQTFTRAQDAHRAACYEYAGKPSNKNYGKLDQANEDLANTFGASIHAIVGAEKDDDKLAEAIKIRILDEQSFRHTTYDDLMTDGAESLQICETPDEIEEEIQGVALETEDSIGFINALIDSYREDLDRCTGLFAAYIAESGNVYFDREKRNKQALQFLGKHGLDIGKIAIGGTIALTLSDLLQQHLH